MQKKILIVEDDKFIAELIKFYLDEEGYETKVIMKEDNIIEKIHQYAPDVITLDVFLEKTSGIRNFEYIKNDKRTRDIPVIFISGASLPSLKLKEMGAAGYLSKPYQAHEIKNVIKKIIKGTCDEENIDC